MANVQKYPLLIQGIHSDPSGSRGSITPGGSLAGAGWSNNIKTGRGDLVAIDPVTTFTDLTYFDDTYLGEFSYYVGSETVIENAPLSRYVPAVKPRSYELIQLRQPGGQSVKLSFNNASTGPGIMMHHYFENIFAVPEIIAARNHQTLKPKIMDFVRNVAAGAKLSQSGTFTVPTGKGNVVAVELIAERGTTSAKTLMTGLITVAMGGTTIFEDVNMGICQTNSGRPGLIFPILVRGGETFTITTDSSAMSGTAKVYVRLYFDDDYSGKKTYNLARSC